MSYDEALAARVRRTLAERTDVVEKKMFGGLCFMVNGAMCCGITKTDFMVRVGLDDYDRMLREPYARAMDFTGRPLAGMVYVANEGLRKDAILAQWVERGVTFVAPPTTEGRKGVGRAKKNAAKRSKTTAARPGRALAVPKDVDPRVSRLLAELRRTRDLAPIVDAFRESKNAGSPRKFGSNGLKANGRLFALFTQRTLVVKLPKARVLELVSAGIGKPFDPGHGRLMKEWLTVSSPAASWLALAKEAHEFVRG